MTRLCYVWVCTNMQMGVFMFAGVECYSLTCLLIPLHSRRILRFELDFDKRALSTPAFTVDRHLRNAEQHIFGLFFKATVHVVENHH